MKQSAIEAERTSLAAEVQRLTDAVHDRTSESELPASATTQSGAAGVATVSPSPTKDAVGRPVEESLADIEDLIANSVPSPQNRR